MEAIYFGNNAVWGKGFASGPWILTDMENGLWAGSNPYTPSNVPLSYPFQLAMVKGATDGFTIKGADATMGKLQLMYAGERPTCCPYQPMKKQGAIILGIGGDNSHEGVGTWFEGVLTQGFSSDDIDDAVDRNIIMAGYGR